MATIINASTSAGLIQTADTSGTLQLQSNGVTQQTIDSTGSYGQLKQGTAQASTSGTSITFSSIPSWAKRITVMFNGVSTSGTSNLLVQLGSGSTTTSGYTETNSSIKNGVSPGVGTVTNGFVIGSAILASSLNSGQTVFTNISSNIWTCSSQLADSVQPSLSYCAGVISLAGALDRVVITTVNGTDTFDAGSINILWEG